MWRDTFHDRTLTRSYWGNRRNDTSNSVDVSQVIPIFNVAQCFNSEFESTMKQMPALFCNYKEVRQSHNLDFVLSPLKESFKSYVDDQLALVSVCIERFAAARKRELKRTNPGEPKLRLLETKKNEKEFRRRLLGSANELINEFTDLAPELRDTALSVVENRIGDMLKPPNSMVLEKAFESVGLELSELEKQYLKLRNRALHGESVLENLKLESIELEQNRVDTLRTLINKAILKLIAYEGTYCDFGVEPLQCTIRNLDPS